MRLAYGCAAAFHHSVPLYCHDLVLAAFRHMPEGADNAGVVVMPFIHLCGMHAKFDGGAAG